MWETIESLGYTEFVKLVLNPLGYLGSRFRLSWSVWMMRVEVKKAVSLPPERKIYCLH